MFIELVCYVPSMILGAKNTAVCEYLQSLHLLAEEKDSKREQIDTGGQATQVLWRRIAPVRGRDEIWDGVVVVGEGLSEEATIEQRPGGGEGIKFCEFLGFLSQPPLKCDM